jgi:plastocyanin
MADHQLQISMSGYNPNSLTIGAGRSTTVEVVNSESPFHDGGGLHNFVLPEVEIDTIIPAKSSVVVTLPALPAGTYTFYCDVCCGGKENPTMRATLIVV